jgi:hypothetical protein
VSRERRVRAGGRCRTVTAVTGVVVSHRGWRRMVREGLETEKAGRVAGFAKEDREGENDGEACFELLEGRQLAVEVRCG